MSAPDFKREELFAHLASLQPPDNFDELALANFVVARQRLLEELKAIGTCHNGPLTGKEKEYHFLIQTAGYAAMQTIRVQQANILTELAHHRRAIQQLREYGSNTDTSPQIVDHKG
jgi:hypothetical protein